MLSEDGRAHIVGMLTMCENCNQSFDSHAFGDHICDYDDHKSLIYDEELYNTLWDDSILRRMHHENQNNIQMLSTMMSGTSAGVYNARGRAGTSSGPSNYTCPVCNRMYVHASGLARHLDTHNTGYTVAAFACTVDDKQSADVADVAGDASIVDTMAVDVFKCLICGQLFNSSEHCLQHMSANHTDYAIDENHHIQQHESSAFERATVNQVFQCEYCMAIFDDTDMLNRHQLQHDITAGFECSNCNICSRNLKFIVNHRSRECPFEKFRMSNKIDATVLFVCSQCEFVTSTMMKLYEHRYVGINFAEPSNRSQCPLV